MLPLSLTCRMWLLFRLKLYSSEVMDLQCCLSIRGRCSQDGGLSRGEVTAAQERIAALMASINDNQSESGKIREEILDNEEQRKNLQAEIDHATRTNTDTAFLQVGLQCMAVVQHVLVMLPRQLWICFPG